MTPKIRSVLHALRKESAPADLCRDSQSGLACSDISFSENVRARWLCHRAWGRAQLPSAPEQQSADQFLKAIANTYQRSPPDNRSLQPQAEGGRAPEVAKFPCNARRRSYETD